MTEPHASGLLDTGDGNRVYWETSGDPAGIPVVMVHGGPGIPLGPGSRRAFDPSRHRIVVFHQRNCGLSLPHASDPAAAMPRNTTAHLVSDMESLREHLGVDRWMVHGGSWGSTLALAYAQAHPERVSGLMLVAVMTSARRELEWLYRGAGLFFPEAWERFCAVGGGGRFRSPRDVEPPISGLLAAYSSMMEDSDRAVRLRAAEAWVAWENAFISLEANGRPDYFDGRSEDFKIAFVRICAHYFANDAFLEDGTLLRNVHRLAGIPGILIHGRADLSLPVITVWELARAWSGSELIVVDDAGHTGSPALRELQRDARERLSALVAAS